MTCNVYLSISHRPCVVMLAYLQAHGQPRDCYVTATCAMISHIQVLLSAADTAKHLIVAIPTAFPPWTVAYLVAQGVVVFFCTLKHPPPQNL